MALRSICMYLADACDCAVSRLGTSDRYPTRYGALTPVPSPDPQYLTVLASRYLQLHTPAQLQ